MKPCSLLLFSLLTIIASASYAQGGSNSAGGLTLPVGQTSAIQTATLTFTTATSPGTPFTINVLMRGSPGLDFNLAPGGTCTTTAAYAVGDTCTVDYTFSPLHPGIRYGGISLTLGVTPLANTYVRGTGLGPQATFLPAKQIIHGGGLYFPSSFDIDGAGNIYVSYFFGSNVSGSLAEIPVGCFDYTCVQYLFGFDSFAGTTNASPEAIALDGSGNIYVAFQNFGIVPFTLYEIPKGCTSYSCSIPIGDDGGVTTVKGQPLNLAVDGDGNVYVIISDTTGIGAEVIKKIPRGCASASCVTTISSQYNFLENLAVDQNDNVYYNASAASLIGAPSGASTNGVVYKIPNGCASISCTVQISPPGVSIGLFFALDGNGDIFLEDAHYVYEIPAGCATTACELTVNPQNPIPSATSMKSDANGNPYVLNYDNADDDVYEFNLADPATVTFPLTAQGQVGPAQTVTVGNNGNEPLLFTPSITQTNPTISQYFQLDTTSSGTCGALIAASTAPALAAAQICTLPIDFAPLAPVLGTVNGTVVLADNSLNVLSATQTIPLVGTAVLPGSTTLTLTSSLNPAFAGIGVTFTAQLTSPSGTPTGSVTFSDGATVLATVPVSGAAAAFTTSSLTPGTHTINATFTPTGIYLASNASLSQLITPDTALATLSATPASALVGAPVALSVALSGTPAGPTPTGTVTFTSNGAPIGTATIVNGVASLTTTTLAAGTDTLTCTYSGDSNYAADNCANTLIESILTQAVATRLSLASSLNPANALQPLSFSTTLTFGRSFLSGVQITFAIDGAVVGTVVTGTNGQATFALPAGLAPGQHTVTATSAAFGIYAAATASLVEAVTTPDFTLTLTPPSLTLATGTFGIVAVNLQSVAGFTGPVTLACAPPLPLGIACAFDTAQPAIPANGSVATNLHLKTTALALNNAPTLRYTSPTDPLRDIRLATLLPLSLLGLLRLSRRRTRLLPLILLSLYLVANTLTGCGGGYAGSAAPGTYSIPVIAQSATTSHTINLSLSVTR